MLQAVACCLLFLVSSTETHFPSISFKPSSERPVDESTITIIVEGTRSEDPDSVHDTVVCGGCIQFNSSKTVSVGLTEVEDHDVVLSIGLVEGGVSEVLDETITVPGGADGTSNGLRDTEDINLDGKIDCTISVWDRG